MRIGRGKNKTKQNKKKKNLQQLDENILIIIGLLSAVGSLTLSVQSSWTLTWSPPFTLDINGVDPDIAGYCVDIVNSTSSSLLCSECEVNVTEFTYPIPPRSWCYNYTFTITPVNVVGNGTSSSLNYSTSLGCKMIDVMRQPCTLSHSFSPR